MVPEVNTHATEEGELMSLTRGENEEHEHRVRDLEEKPFEWLSSRAQHIGIPDWNQLEKPELVQRLAESAASPSH